MTIPVLVLYVAALVGGWVATRLFFYFNPLPDGKSRLRAVWTLLGYELFALAVLFDVVFGTAAALGYYLPPSQPIPHPVNFLLVCLLGGTLIQCMTYARLMTVRQKLG